MIKVILLFISLCFMSCGDTMFCRKYCQKVLPEGTIVEVSDGMDLTGKSVIVELLSRLFPKQKGLKNENKKWICKQQ